MLHFFRRFLSSKFGAALAIGVLILIALAFASGDVANRASFGGVTGGDRVALVGGERIDSSTLSQAATTALERMKEDNPKMSMKGLLTHGGLDKVLDELTDRLAVAVFGKRMGIVASDRLVDSEIAKMPAFRGADGNFSEKIFRQAVSQRGISEESLRDDLKQGLIARQVMVPASFGAVMPHDMVKRYAALLTETREGQIAVLPSMLFAPKDKPTDKQLAAYYTEHKDDFIRPERRVVRYASFDASVMKDVPKPTEAEIAARYKANIAQYQAVERRRISQLVVPTQAAAQAIIDEVDKGKSLEAAAKEKGLSVAKLESFDRADLTRRFSKEVADSVFATPLGKVAKPAKSPLGWHVVRVEDIQKQPARSLDDVRAELTAQIAKEKLNTALTDKLENIEDEFDSGTNLTEMAKSLGIEVKQTKPITADGKVYGEPGKSAPDVLKTVLATAFSMDLEKPQLAIVDHGAHFVMYDVTDIAASAPAPLDEIKDDVKAAYILDKASAEARKLAVKVQAEVRKGKSLRSAIASLKKPLPPPQPIRMSRPQLSQFQQQGRQVPPPIGLLFNMAVDTVKVQATPNKQAWFIIKLDKIVPGKMKDDDPSLVNAQKDLGKLAGNEYEQALQRAIRAEIGVEKNKTAIRAVRQQLGGGS